MVPVVPKLQHDPQTAWSLTGVTAPKVKRLNRSYDEQGISFLHQAIE